MEAFDVVSTRRIGLEDSETRALLLDAAERVMVEEGYAAVSSRRIAEKASLKHQLVYYYFRTMDDLFLALIRRRTERGLVRLTQALASDKPTMRAVWEFCRDPTDAALTVELMALGNHRKAVAAEIIRYSEQIRTMQAGAISRILKDHGIDPGIYPPIAMMLLINAISRVLVMEDTLGMSAGHAELEMVVELWLRQLGDEQHETKPDSGPGRKRARATQVR
jgi:AcrR family transcriptional regulator